MRLMELLKNRMRRDVCVIQLAEDIADGCFELVWQRVQGRVLALAPAEARGYVRARARGVLLQELAYRRLGNGHDERIFSKALDLTLRRVASQAHAIRVQRIRRQAA